MKQIESETCQINLKSSENRGKLRKTSRKLVKIFYIAYLKVVRVNEIFENALETWKKIKN